MKKIFIAISLFLSLTNLLAKETVNILFPYSAGSTADIVIRNIASFLDNEKYNFIVTPASGAAGLVAIRNMQNNKKNSITVIGNGVLGFDNINLEKDLTLIYFLGFEPTIIAVNSNSKFNSIKDLIDESKFRQIPFGSSGVGSYGHLSSSIIAANNKNIIHIPYKSTGQAVPDLLAGRIDFLVMDENLFERISPNGQLRPIAANYHTKLQKFPNVKTFKEQGLNNFNFYRWETLVVDPDIDKELLQYLQTKFSSTEFLNLKSKVQNFVYEDIDYKNFFIEQKKIADEIRKKFIKD